MQKLPARVAERVRAAMEDGPFDLSGGRQIIGHHFGWCFKLNRQVHDSVAELMKRADRALYEAKNSGRNRVVQLAA